MIESREHPLVVHKYPNRERPPLNRASGSHSLGAPFQVFAPSLRSSAAVLVWFSR